MLYGVGQHVSNGEVQLTRTLRAVQLLAQVDVMLGAPGESPFGIVPLLRLLLGL